MRFNEGKNLWAGLEDFLLKKASAEGKRLTVFTGPVFRDDDVEFRGVQICFAPVETGTCLRGS
jgi:endonuclease G